MWFEFQPSLTSYLSNSIAHFSFASSQNNSNLFELAGTKSVMVVEELDTDLGGWESYWRTLQVTGKASS